MRRAKNQGVTLIEMAIYICVLATITLAIYALIHFGSKSYGTTTRKNTMQQSAMIVLERMAEELRNAHPDDGWLVGKDVDIDGTELPFVEFKPVIWRTKEELDALYPASAPHAAGQIEVGKLVRYQFQKSSADANNNGVKDEGKITRTQEEEQKDGSYLSVTSDICHHVKLSGFVLTELTGPLRLQITLTMAVVDEQQKEVTSTVSTTVLLRNKVI